MIKLRSRTVTSTSDSSVSTPSSKTLKKSRSRKSKLCSSKSSIEASDVDNVFNESQKSTKSTSGDEKTSKRGRKTRHTKLVETCTDEVGEKVSKSEPLSENHEENYTSGSNSSENESKLTKKSRRTKKRRSSTQNQTSTADVPTMDQNVSVKEEKVVNDVKNVTFESKNHERSGSVDLFNESVKFTKLVNDCKHTSLFDTSGVMMELSKFDTSSSGDDKNKTITQDQSCFIINDTLESSKINLKTDKNGTFDKNNTTFDKNVTYDKSGTFNVSVTVKNATFDKNNTTFEKINVTFEKLDNELNKSRNRRSSRRDTYQIKNSSGKWSVDDNSLLTSITETPDRVTLHKEKNSSRVSSILPVLNEDRITLHKNKNANKSIINEEENPNISIPLLNEDRITLHKNKNANQSIINEKEKSPEKINETFNEKEEPIGKKPDLNGTFDTPSKSIRKKWVKFENKIVQSPILRKSINFSANKSQICSSTPFTKYPLTPARSKSISKNKSLNEISSNSKSIKKSGRKPGTMPNFAKIHQLANEKIESIKEYSERKKERAEKLLSGEKPEIDTPNHKTNVVKSSDELFGNMKTKQNISISKTKRKSRTPEKALSTFVTKKLASKLPQLKSKIPFTQKEKSKTPKITVTQHESILNKTTELPTAPKIKSIPKENKLPTKIDFKPKVVPKLKHTNLKVTEKSILKDSNKSTTKTSQNKSTIEAAKPRFGFSKLSAERNKTFDSPLNKSITKKPVITKPKLDVSLNKTKPSDKPSVYSKGHFDIGKVTIDVKEAPKSVFSKGHCQAVANKMKTTEKLANRDNRRDQLKGVRTNRRFDLLMKMRNND